MRSGVNNYMRLSEKVNSINWSELQSFYDLGGTYRDITKLYGLSSATISRAVKAGLLKTKKRFGCSKGRKHTEASKQKIREARITFLEQNPSHKLWGSGKRHYNSAVSNKVKDFLKNMGEPFVEEFQPLLHKNRFYSIDIAFPDKMIGWEVNGGQHYDENGKLKPYYQERHRLIENEGWILAEIHYKDCFNEVFLQSLYAALINRRATLEFNYTAYAKPAAKPANICACGKKICRESKACLKCSSVDRGRRIRRVDRPTAQELERLIGSMSFAAVGRLYRVTDNSIRKWCKSCGIQWRRKPTALLLS